MEEQVRFHSKSPALELITDEKPPEYTTRICLYIMKSKPDITALE
jgi:hypothetical protein